MNIFLALLFLATSALANEAGLMQECAKRDIPACVKLGAFYLSKSEWEKAYIVGEALCSKGEVEGCTYAGAALLAQSKIPEASKFLTKACDEFEPYACRSLGRLMKKTGESALSKMYFKRSCFYGLREQCAKTKDAKPLLSGTALSLVKQINTDCEDPKHKFCEAHLSAIKTCAPPLTKQDCQLLAGHLSIYFRAKFLQAEAKLHLLSLHTALRALKGDPKIAAYTYDLSKALRDVKQKENHRYVFGFMASCAKKYVKGRKVKTTSLELYPKSYKALGVRAQANIRLFFSKGPAADCYDPKAGYEAFAVGALDPEDPSRLDVWRVNQDKDIENVRDGLPEP